MSMCLVCRSQVQSSASPVRGSEMGSYMKDHIREQTLLRQVGQQSHLIRGRFPGKEDCSVVKHLCCSIRSPTKGSQLQGDGMEKAMAETPVTPTLWLNKCKAGPKIFLVSPTKHRNGFLDRAGRLASSWSVEGSRSCLGLHRCRWLTA